MEEKNALARYFADENKTYETQEVVTFLRQVGKVNNKPDVAENAEGFGAHLVEVMGFSNGEEFLQATLEDLMAILKFVVKLSL